MKRRGFLGFLGGAAVAGPGMVKQAAAQGLSDLSVQNAVGLAPRGYIGEPNISFVSKNPDRSWVSEKWRAFRSIVDSAEMLARKKREMNVANLDPDLAASRSFSLDAKIRMQRERNFKAWLEREQGWFARNWDAEDETTRWY